MCLNLVPEVDSDVDYGSYRRLLSAFYRQCLGLCRNLRVSGIVHFVNRRQIWLGSNVLLKRNCELLPSLGVVEKAIFIGDHSEVHEDCVLRTFDGYVHIGTYCSLNRLGIVFGWRWCDHWE